MGRSGGKEKAVKSTSRSRASIERDIPSDVLADGTIEFKNYFGKLNRVDAPARIFPLVESGDATIQKEEYWDNGELIKTVINEYSSDPEESTDGYSKTETYDPEGRLHSFNGEPSIIASDSYGGVEEQYHNHGELIDAKSSLVSGSINHPEQEASQAKSTNSLNIKKKEDPFAPEETGDVELDSYEMNMYEHALKTGLSKEESAQYAREAREDYIEGGDLPGYDGPENDPNYQ